MLDFTVIFSNRRTICLEVGRDQRVKVRAPYGMAQGEIIRFVESHAAWIEKAVRRQGERVCLGYDKELSAEQIAELRAKASSYIPPRVTVYAKRMGLFPSAVKISAAVSRLGSCSPKNSLNFSYRLMLYPVDAIDYVIVHELAHIRHRNHSKEFYKLVEAYLPDYKKRAALLKA